MLRAVAKVNAVKRSLLFAIFFLLPAIVGGVQESSVSTSSNPSTPDSPAHALTPREAAITRGDIQMARKDYEQAVMDYQLALQLDQKDAVVLNKIGIAYQQLGDLDQAM